MQHERRRNLREVCWLTLFAGQQYSRWSKGLFSFVVVEETASVREFWTIPPRSLRRTTNRPGIVAGIQVGPGELELAIDTPCSKLATSYETLITRTFFSQFRQFKVTPFSNNARQTHNGNSTIATNVCC